MNMVSGAKAALTRIRTRSWEHRPDTTAEDRALRIGVESAAVSIWRKNSAFDAHIAGALRYANGRRAGERRVAFPAEDRLASKVHGNK